MISVLYRMEDKVHALILRTADYGDADRMLTLFTKEQGLLHVGAKGVRRVGSRFFGLTEPFSLVEMIVQNRGQNLYLRQATLMDSLYALRLLPVSLAYAGYLCALCESALPVQEKEEDLYEALLRALFLLRDGVEPKSVCVPFLLFLFQKSGIYPLLTQCVLCANKQAHRFSIEHGGLVCDTCRPQERRISDETLLCLKKCKEIEDIPLSFVTSGAMELLNLYASRHFEKNFPAWQVIRRMDESLSSR